MSSFIDTSNTRVNLKGIAIILTRDNRFGTKPRDLVNGAAYGKCRKIDSAFDVLDTAMLDTAFDVLDT